MAAPPLDLFRVDRAWVRVRGVRDGEPSSARLLSWLSSREEVAEVSFRAEAEVLDVRFRDESAKSGAFLRALEDRLFLLSRAPVAARALEPAHVLPGRARFRLSGATADELLRVAAWLSGRDGVLRASASPASSSLLVIFDEAVASAATIARDVLASDPGVWPEPARPPPRQGTPALALSCAVLAGALTGAVPHPLLAAGTAIASVPAARRAIAALRARRVTVDLLDLAAIGISLARGHAGTAAFITGLLGAGDLILERSSDTARAAVSRLMALDAAYAWRLDGERVTRVRAEALRPGDRVVVETGLRVPADGLVVSGEAAVDEKALTGESIPRARSAGSGVLAASVVVEGQLVVEVQRAGSDTTAAKIVQILEGAGSKPMTLQREVERVTDRLVLPTFGVAALAAAATAQIDRATSVLITDFGTGVRIVVPTAALASMAVAARRGILVKGAQYLERLSRADVVVLDKTGTVTTGTPSIVGAEALGPLPLRYVMGLAAAAEARQAHPMAAAIRAYAAAVGAETAIAELGTERAVIGLGVEATVEGHDVVVGAPRLCERRGIRLTHLAAAMAAHRSGAASSLVVAIDGAPAAILACADAARPESAAVVRALRAGGRREVVLLSGDARAVVARTARDVGADRGVGEVMPEDKAAYVRARQSEGRVVAMVGDGINDAPALALSDVGISLSGGTDVALETADVLLLDGGLARLPEAFALGERAMREVRRGLFLVLAPNVAGVALGAVGLLSPAMAAALNNGSTAAAALAALLPLLSTPPGAGGDP